MKHTFDATLAPADPDINGLLDKLQQFFADHSLHSSLVQCFALTFDELISNIVMYGAAREPIQVHLSITDSEVSAWIIDDGVPFDPLSLPDPDVTSGVEERPVGGVGIYIARKMMDRMTYERDELRNRISLSKRIDTPTPE
ncbi:MULTISPECIES: ATP-binding protein [unclassified Paraburkholderia]|uniref:ATP-binding protein n=1 Tax=unclassified Paraburkholderia TaxID=2615204 RepID=UPI002AB6C9CD|nr:MULTISPECIES: ATP-binding protein [unclassified Paraburkholderia]